MKKIVGIIFVLSMNSLFSSELIPSNKETTDLSAKPQTVVQCIKNDNEWNGKQLIAQCSDINKPVDETGKTMLHYACEFNALNILMILREHPKIDFNVQCKMGRTPLMFACQLSKPPGIIEDLLNRKADISIVDHSGKSVFDVASRFGRLDLDNHRRKLRADAQQIPSVLKENLADSTGSLAFTNSSNSLESIITIIMDYYGDLYPFQQTHPKLEQARYRGGYTYHGVRDFSPESHGWVKK